MRGIFIVSIGLSSSTKPASSRRPTMMRGTPAKKDCPWMRIRMWMWIWMWMRMCMCMCMRIAACTACMAICLCHAHGTRMPCASTRVTPEART